jgi:hypothetical protein
VPTLGVDVGAGGSVEAVHALSSSRCRTTIVVDRVASDEDAAGV